jgi:hypothetical protein
MSRNGGYIIFNLGSLSRTSGEASTLDGAYEIAANPYGKATLISGLVVGNVAYPDFFAPFVAGESSYTAEVAFGSDTITIAVSEGDNVTVTVTEQEP